MVYLFHPGHPVSQSGQEVLCSEPTVCQQHRRLRPPSNKPHHCYLSGCPQGLPLPPSCLFHSTSTPTSPVHPLHPHRCLQCSMVRSSSQPVHPTPGSCAAGASACQHLAAPGPLPCHSWGAGADSRAGASPGFPSGQRSAEVSQQPRRTQPEDHVGLGVRAGPDAGPTGLDWTGLESDRVAHARSANRSCAQGRQKWRSVVERRGGVKRRMQPSLRFVCCALSSQKQSHDLPFLLVAAACQMLKD